MRIAAVAFVLIVGAAVVLAFANTLNSWVLGGLLGGLAAILLCIPISLAIFLVVSRRQEARQRAEAEAQAEAEDIAAFYEDELMVYEAEGYALPIDEEHLLLEAREQYPSANPRAPVSGYLALPPAEQEYDPYEEEQLERLTRRDPRNYPRQPRYPVRSLEPHEDIRPQAPTTGSTRRPATRSLAQHQSAALHRARREALQQQHQTQKGSDAPLPGRRSPNNRFSSTQRPRTSRGLNAPERSPERYQSEDDYTDWQSSMHPSWHEEEDRRSASSTEGLRERYPQYPRRSTHPRAPRARMAEPWTGELNEEEEWEEELRSSRLPRDPERLSGSLRNPLVRRAPYLYDDDHLSEEFSRQLDSDHPITRRSSRYDHFRQNDQE